MNSYWQGENVTLYHGDCVTTMAALPADSIDAIVTDPPYGLGFMGKAWDDLPPGLEWAQACLRVLKPGGHLLAFGGTRTWHRLAVAIEDAGFEIRDSIAWLYGSGFPKSLDVSKAIDKAAGAEREVIGVTRKGMVPGLTSFVGNYQQRESADITSPATVDAQQWAGWGTALKPAHEPCLVARKPLTLQQLSHRIGSHIERLEHEWQAQAADPTTPIGAAAGSRGTTDTSWFESARNTFWNTVTSWKQCLAELSEQPSTSTTSTTYETTTGPRTLLSSISSLTPTNMLQPATSPPGLTLTASAVDNLFVSVVCASRATRALSAVDPATAPMQRSPRDGAGASAFEPIVVARKPLVGTVAANVQAYGTGALNIDACRIEAAPGDYAHPGNENRTQTTTAYGKFEREGRQAPPNSAGRWPANVVLDADQAATLNQQSGVTASTASAGRQTANHGTVAFSGPSGNADKIAGHTDSGGASRFFYVAKAPTVERPKQGGIAHPTVKPIDLMQWLVRLVTPPGGVVLDPFAGSGTTGEATIREGFRSILIEREADYLPLIRERFRRPINYLLDFGDPA